MAAKHLREQQTSPDPNPEAIAQPPSSSDVPVPPADTPPLKAQKAQTRRQVTTHSREDYMTQSDRPDFHGCTQRMVSAYVDTVDGTVQDGMNTRSCPLLFPNAQDLVPSPAASNDLSPYWWPEIRNSTKLHWEKLCHSLKKSSPKMLSVLPELWAVAPSG